MSLSLHLHITGSEVAPGSDAGGLQVREIGISTQTRKERRRAMPQIEFTRGEIDLLREI
ncbi:MAG: hypothetical protein H6Q42_4544, partial [Deltaproteobacteria bacterium]|nr:hypothetical protein [Deltaproteobacteria bacterium]